MSRLAAAGPSSPSYLIPNLVVFGRVVLAFVSLALLSGPPHAAMAGVLLIAVVLYLDALDGILARRLGVASELGAVLDIVADRIVEHVYWIWFAVLHVVAPWVPLVVVTRSFVVDAVRSFALARGHTAFGEKTMMRSGVGRFMVASRLMRNAYGLAKVAAFLLLGALVLGAKGQPGAAPAFAVWLAPWADALVVLAVALCVLRGAPVVWEGRRYLTAPTP